MAHFICNLELTCEDLRHCLADYNIMGSGYQQGTRYEQLQIVNALRLGERERASKMLLNIGYASGSLRADDFAYILNYCAETPDPLVSNMSN